MMGITPRHCPSRMVPLIILAAAILCSPVLAHSAAQMGAAPDQFDTGIPVYWPYHATLMSAGAVLLGAGMVVMRFSKKPGRFSVHRVLQTGGTASFTGGLAVAVYMVTLSGVPHLAFSHDQLGAVAFILIVLSLAIGYYIFTPRGKPGVRKVHPWAGRLAIALAVVNIALGISMMGFVLSQ